MKRTLLTIVLLFFSLIGFSQIIGIDYYHKVHTDKLEIKCNQSVTINLKYPAFNYRNSLSHEAYTIKLLINSAKRILNKLELDKNESYELILEYPITCAGIECKEKEKFKFELQKSDPEKETYSASDYGDSIKRISVNIIRFQEDFIQIEYSDISQLDSILNIDFDSFFKTYTEYVKEQKLYKYALYSFYSYQHNEFEKERIIKMRRERPYIAIRPSAGIGVGVIKGKLINNGSILIESSFNDTGKGAIRLYTQYELFTNYVENKIYTSGFINLGANLNLSDDYQPKDWIGFGLGYIIHQQELSIFKQNTLKLYFERQIKMGLKFKPELYYDINNSELFMGLSVSLNI